MQLPDTDDDFFPEPEPSRPRRQPPVYAAIHLAYHNLGDRLEASLTDIGVSPSEAVVLRAIRRDPGVAIAVIRLATGLKRTTLSSLLRRLEAAGLVARDPRTWDARSAALVLTALGNHIALQAEGVLADVDDELQTWLARSRLDAAVLIAEAAQALGRPARPADY